MLTNRDQPASPHRLDTGVDEPINYLGLTKREHMVIQLLAGKGSVSDQVLAGAIETADRLLELLVMDVLPAKLSGGKPTSTSDETDPSPTGEQST